MKNRMMPFTFAACAAVLACALGASAATVTATQAAKAACAWAVREGRTSAQALGTSSLATTNRATYFAVNLQGGGTVITTGDTALEPIVLVTGETVDLSSLDRRCPLWSLLNGDAVARAQGGAVAAAAQKATLPLATKAALAVGLQTTANSANAEKWSALIAEGESLAATPAFTTGLAFGDSWYSKPYTAFSVSDVRVAPLCKTQWSQDNAQDKATYNYYTPNGPDPAAFEAGHPSNIVCGCVATAMSQVMRYFEWPKASVTPITRACGWNTTTLNLTMQGGVYDWENMSLVPESGTLTEDQRKAIGKLTSDTGISVYMQYNRDNGGESGAYSFDIGVALRSVFGYSDATYFSDYYKMITSTNDPNEFTEVRTEALQRSIYANLDAGLPMVMGLTGHQVVADGYGYSSDGLDYVHINMGWAGYCDWWYCLPSVVYDPSALYGGNLPFKDVTYNIFTNVSTKSAVISGRLYDDDGEPIEGATVRFYRTSDDSLQATVTSSDKGVYGAVVPVGSYTVEATGNGLTAEKDVTVSAPVTQNISWNEGIHGKIPTVASESPSDLGNSWGNDIELSLPSARIRDGEIYTSLDKALAAAKEGDTVEVLYPTELKKSVTLDVNCTLVSTNGDPTATLVSRRDGALIAVAAGKTLALSNVVFAVDAVQPTIDVEAGAVLKIAGTLGIGTVSTADAGGIDLCGPLALADGYDVSIDSPNGATGGAFGTFSCDYATANEKAKLISNARDLDLGGVADSSTGNLKWGVVTVPADSAKVAVDIGAGTVGYRTFAAALKAVSGHDAQITLRQNVTHTNTVTLASDLTLTATNGAVLSFGEYAGFVIPAGTDMTLTNVTVSGEGVSIRDCAFKVTGGSLTLGGGATLTDFSDETSWKDYSQFYGGAVVVTSGSVAMKSGSLIENCVSHSQGGAIWLNSTNATANLLGGTITGCAARSSAGGGAVYAGYLGAKINVAGDFTATDNTMGPSDSATTGNLYLSRLAVLTLTGEFTGAVGVSFGKRNGYSDLNVLKANFIVLDSAVTEAQAKASAACFSHDAEETFVGKYDEDTATIVWAEIGEEDDGQCEESVAGVRVTVEGVDGYRYYSCIDDAFDYVKTNATFEVKGFVSGDTSRRDGITKDVTIDHDVRITTWDGYEYEYEYEGDYYTADIMILWRTCHAMYKVVSGGSLTLSNVKIAGACSYGSGYSPWDDEAGHAFKQLFYDEDDDGNPIAVEKPSEGYGLISVDGGSLTLEDGARVGFVFGNTSRASNAITVFNGGRVTMEAGSRVMEVDNEYRDDYETSCGGGILLDRSTGYFEGGLIYHCKAYRAGGLYAANGSTAYVSGDIFIGWNSAHKYDGEENTDDNVIVSKNSNFILAGPLSCADPDGDAGYIGVNEGVAGDTSCFATVDWAWTDFEALKECARYFRHDTRKLAEPVYDPEWEEWDYTVYGTAVTNGEGKAVLVWEDSLSQANGITIDGEIYRSAIPAGLTVATPNAFSVSPTTGANGKQVLNLDGGVEGCWYTVYSTTDLSLPFAKEASVQLKAGETFEYEVDQTAAAKFYKVVAEEGLK